MQLNLIEIVGLKTAILKTVEIQEILLIELSGK